MKLIRLRKEDINEFNRLMQESFQFGYESVYGEDKEMVLPLEDIMKSINNPNCYSYEMLNDENEIIGGAIVEINDNNNKSMLALKAYCKVLSDREQEIIRKRYGFFGEEEVTQRELADQLKISRSYVSRIEKRATTKILREFIKNQKKTNK